MSRSAWITSLAVFWLVIACGYVAAALRQKEQLNLSATAGGQMPYLVYAQNVAMEGVFGYFGDRNRMPLVPVLASAAYDSDWNRFVNRASWLAIGLSLVLLAAMGVIAYLSLSPLSATAFLLVMAVTVFAPQASFLQADVPYYALFFCSWWAMSRLLRRPSPLFAACTGMILGLTFLTKASILLAIPLWTGMIFWRALWNAQGKTPPRVSPSIDMASRPSWGRWVGAACITILVFLAVVFPYLRNNKERFGRYFYNVNTTFFVWCDSWPQAEHFAEKYAIDVHFPDAAAESIPGPLNYWRTHTTGQIASRLAYGLKTLGRLVVASSTSKYLAPLFVFATIAAFLQSSCAREILYDHRFVIAWTTVLLLAYVLAYSWYVVVAYGDRFVLSLVAPLLFGLFAFLERVLRGQPVSRSWLARFPVAAQLAVLILLLTLADGIAAANSSWITPSPEFVRFYYDESHEELRRGNMVEAHRGMRGVITLDPEFAAAYRDLGMIALAQGKAEEAVESLTKAGRLEPTWADVQNSLGSALIQAGRPAEAVPILERATALKPDMTSAWYNLCGALLQLNEKARAEQCMTKLEQLSPRLARDLRAAFPTSAPQDERPTGE